VRTLRFVRGIGAVIVALCLMAGGAARPARASQLDPSNAELSAAKALRAELAPRRSGDVTPDRRAPGSPVALAPAASSLPPPGRALHAAAFAATVSPTTGTLSTCSARGPPR
jgi:hypothetical protein